MMPFFSLIKFKSGKIYLKMTQNYKNCVIILGILFCVFASYGGDWYHYWEIVEENYKKTDPYTHLESVHLLIIQYLSFGNYLFWRTLIWGTTFLFIHLSFKKINEDNLITWSCFIVICLLQVSSGRVYLGISILFYGFCCILKANNKFAIIKGLLLMGMSILFHKSIFIYFVASLAALIHMKNWIIVVGVGMIPIFAKIFTSILIIYLVGLEKSNSATVYLDMDRRPTGIGENLYEYAFKSLIFFIFILTFNFSKTALPNYVERKMWQYSFNLVYIFLVVYLALTLKNIGSAVIPGRALIGTYIPLSVLYSKMLHNEYKLKINLIVFVGLYVVNIYQLLYSFYLQRLGTGI